MQCTCGASADVTTQTNRRCQAELRYYLCGQCKQVSDGVLSVRGRDVSWDHGGDAQARRWFEAITPESAETLYNAVASLQNVFSEAEESGAGAGGDLHTQASFSF